MASLEFIFKFTPAAQNAHMSAGHTFPTTIHNKNHNNHMEQRCARGLVPVGARWDLPYLTN